tara:strand:- start:3237 stop:3563 length:327 start_codon:yes stop_codon:yes gene_type:complete
MLSCFKSIILYYFNYNNNKIVNDDIVCPLTKNNNDKYIIIDNNIYVECNICFEVIALQNIRMLYPCGHRLYCDLCIKQIDKCPLCRKEIKEKLVIFENLTIEDLTIDD